MNDYKKGVKFLFFIGMKSHQITIT